MTYYSIDNIQLTFDLDQRVYYENSISIVNPPDLCVGVPFDLAKLCIKFYKLDARNKTLSGSVDVIIKLDGIELKRIKLGSFRFGNGSFFEKNLMKVYESKKKINKTENESANGSSFDQFYQSYDNFINKLNYFPLPKFSFNFQPDRLVDNLYNSLFSGRTYRKKSPKNQSAEGIDDSAYKSINEKVKDSNNLTIEN